MAFSVNFGNSDLPKSVDLLRSKDGPAGKFGRIAYDLLHTCGNVGTAHADDRNCGGAWHLVCRVWPGFARTGD